MVVRGLGNAFIRFHCHGSLIASAARVAKYLRLGGHDRRRFVSIIVAVRTVLLIVAVVPALSGSRWLSVIGIPIVAIFSAATAIPMRVLVIVFIFSPIWSMVLGLLLLSPILRGLPSIVSIVSTAGLLGNRSGRE